MAKHAGLLQSNHERACTRSRCSSTFGWMVVPEEAWERGQVVRGGRHGWPDAGRAREGRAAWLGHAGEFWWELSNAAGPRFHL